MKEVGVKRWVLEGTDYVYPRTTNKILEAFLQQKGVKPEDIMINYTPFGFSDWTSEVAKIKAFGSAGKKTAVVSTINGDANVPFYKELGNQKISAEDIPVVAFSVGEEELVRSRCQAAGRAPGRLELLHEHRYAGQQAVDHDAGTRTPRTPSAPSMIRWRRTSSASSSGSRRCRRPAPPIRRK